MRTKMKNIMIAFSVFFLFLTIGTKQAQAQRASVSFQIFYDQLAPYGEWVNDPDYGYIWLPDVSQDFQPYATNGYWVNTQYGNTWYSNYDWAGRLFIMVVGYITTIMAGRGFPVTNGDQHGYLGGKVAVNTVGHHWAQE
jgi:hypothetical protein